MSYRPSKSQQQHLISLIKSIEPTNDRIIVHHVLEDSFRKLHVQLEYRNSTGITFKRFTLVGD